MPARVLNIYHICQPIISSICLKNSIHETTQEPLYTLPKFKFQSQFVSALQGLPVQGAPSNI